MEQDDEIREAKDAGFIQGIAWAVQILAARGENTFAGELIGQSGFTLRDFRAAKVDEYDMKAVRKIYKSEVKI